jgi:hypothetical protein
LGYWGYGIYFERSPGQLTTAGAAGHTLAQGASYLGVIAGFAMYLIPLAHLVMVAQRIWIHAPLGQTPAGMIKMIRHRGRK